MIFHVLNRGNARGGIFEKEADYLAFEKAIDDALRFVPMRILSYAVMPNHWHFVLWPRSDGHLAKFIQRLTVTHVRRWHAHRGTGGTGHLYQGTYKSFPIEADDHFLTVCRYVERNPLRAGLVDRAQDWQWGSFWRRESGDPESRKLLTDWPVDRPRNWSQLVNGMQSSADLEAIRLSIRRNRPFGTESWQKRTAARLSLQATFNPRGRPRLEK